MMDDMTAFERLIANAARQAVGPPRPVDAASVVRVATAPAGRWSISARRFLITRRHRSWLPTCTACSTTR